MAGQAENGTSALLTVDDATSAFEALLSDEEDPQQPEAPPAEEPEADETEAPEAQDDSDDTEPSEESDESESSETEETPDDAKPATRRIKVNGEEIEVTEEELERGYSRTADYTRKTQALAAEKKDFEAERAAVREERQRYAAALAHLNAALQAQEPAEPDWDSLEQEDPAEYARTWTQWQRYKEQKAHLQQQLQVAQQKVFEDQQAQFRETLKQEREKLLEALPSWQNEEVAKKERAALLEFARESGYSDEELAQVYDHRVVLVLRKAWLYDQAQKQKPTVQQKIERVKVVSPGTPAAKKPAVKEAEKAKQRLAKSGRVDDAAAVFELMLDD